MSNEKMLNFRSLANAVGGDEKSLAEVFKVDVSDIKRWIAGDPAPQAVLDQLMIWVEAILKRAEEITEVMNNSSDDEPHRFKIAVTKRQAYINQFPFPGCEEVVAGIVQARCNTQLDVVPTDEIPGDSADYKRDKHYKLEPETSTFKGTIKGYVQYKDKPAMLLSIDAADPSIPCVLPKNIIDALGKNNYVNTAWTNEKVKVEGTLYYNDFGQPEYIDMKALYNWVDND